MKIKIDIQIAAGASANSAEYSCTNAPNTVKAISICTIIRTSPQLEALTANISL